MKQPIPKQATHYSQGQACALWYVEAPRGTCGIPSRYNAGNVEASVEAKHALLPDRSYVVRTTHNNILRGVRFDAPALRFTMGRSAKSLTLDAVDAVQDGGRFVPIGAWFVEPVE